jgi:uncharacterized membrane protein YgaE (UPF0421/DUF939 family)
MDFNIGPRMVKTGLAVALTLLITGILNLELAIVAAIASVIAMRPSIMRSYTYIKEVVISNSIGLCFALAGYFLLGSHPLSVGAMVVLAIAINVRLGLTKTVSLTTLTVVVMMIGTGEGMTFSYVIQRLSLVAIGVLSAFIINVVVFPPNHDKNLFKMIKKASEKTNFLLRVSTNNTMSVPQVKAEDKEMEDMIDDAKDYFEIIYDERNNIFIRNRIRFFRNIIIYKHMIQVLIKKKELIRQIEKHFEQIEENAGNKKFLIKKLVNEISNYSENIVMLYEDKIVLDKDLQKEAKAAMQITINNLIDELQGSEFDKWTVVFPIASSIIELFYELDKLERFVRGKELSTQKQKKKD